MTIIYRVLIALVSLITISSCAQQKSSGIIGNWYMDSSIVSSPMGNFTFKDGHQYWNFKTGGIMTIAEINQEPYPPKTYMVVEEQSKQWLVMPPDSKMEITELTNDNLALKNSATDTKFTLHFTRLAEKGK